MKIPSEPNLPYNPPAGYLENLIWKLTQILRDYAKQINLLSDHQYGQLAISNNASTIAKTAAVDSTLATNTDYTQITGVFNAIPHGENNGATQQTNSITIGRPAVYYIAMWANVSSSVNNTVIGFKFAVNGVITLVRRPKARVGTANDRINVSAHGFVSLNNGDIITLWMASDKTANILLEDLVFSVNEMKAD